MYYSNFDRDQNFIFCSQDILVKLTPKNLLLGHSFPLTGLFNYKTVLIIENVYG